MNNGVARRDEITSAKRALQILDDPFENQQLRETAIRYLSYQPGERVIKKLVQILQDDDLGVRWEAIVALAQLGEKALPELLKALTDPKRAGDPRLRDAAYHTLQYSRSPFKSISVAKLMQALKDPAADIATMREAGKLLLQLDPSKK